MSTRSLLEFLSKKVVTRKGDGTASLKNVGKLREGLTTIGGQEWAEEALQQLKDAVGDFNSMKDVERAVFIVP